MSNIDPNKQNLISVDENNTEEHSYENRVLQMWQFEIHQIPRPQKQTQFGLKRAYDPSKADKKSIIWQISPHAPKEPFRGPISMSLTFYLPIPKSAKKPHQRKMLIGEIKPAVRPDIDNLAYIVTNALKEIVYIDDGQICDLKLSKRYSDTPKTVIQVCQI